MMNTLVVNGVVRWAAQGIVGFLLARSFIAPGDAAQWTTTFIQFLTAIASIGLLLWSMRDHITSKLITTVASNSAVSQVQMVPATGVNSKLVSSVVSHPKVAVAVDPTA